VGVILKRNHIDAGFVDFFCCHAEPIWEALFWYTGDVRQATESTELAFAEAFSRWRVFSKEPWSDARVLAIALNVRGTQRFARARQEENRRQHFAGTLEPSASERRVAAMLHVFGDLPKEVVAELLGVSTRFVTRTMNSLNRNGSTAELENEAVVE
jgi:hypothetical protein